MLINRNRFSLLLTLFVLCSVCATPQVSQSYADRTVKNDTGGPLCPQAIQDIADVCITGKEASFDSDDNLSKGSGYIQARPDKRFYVVVSVSPSDARKNDLNAIMIRMFLTRIDFDDNAKTSSVVIASPVIETSSGTELKATSTGKVMAKNGIIDVSLEGGRKLSIPVNSSLRSRINNADFLLSPKTKDEKK